MLYNDIPCLMFHHIIDDNGDWNKFSVKYSSLEKYLKKISLMGFGTVGFSDISSVKRPVVLTFDDGDKSNLRAAHLLAESGMKAVFYIIKNSSLYNKGFLSAAEIKEIAGLGHEIGVHGKYHQWWTLKKDEILVEELMETKHWLEDITGESVISCSAPGGQINRHVFNNIADNCVGFEYVRNSYPKLNILDNKSIQIINSVAIKYSTMDCTFDKILKGDVLVYKQLQVEWSIKKILRPIYSKFQQY